MRTAAGLEQATGHWLSGLVIVIIALAVRRGSRLAAWSLVGYSVLEILIRLVSAKASGLFLPIILFTIALSAAVQLRRISSTITEQSAWTHLLDECAFLQATLTGVVLVCSFTYPANVLREATIPPNDLWSIVDVLILLGLGVAA